MKALILGLFCTQAIATLSAEALQPAAFYAKQYEDSTAAADKEVVATAIKSIEDAFNAGKASVGLCIYSYTQVKMLDAVLEPLGFNTSYDSFHSLYKVWF